MAFSTITEEAQDAMGVTGLPDTPALDTHDIQVKFDELGNAAIDWIQTFIEELGQSSAAASIGCNIPPNISASEAKLQNVINAIARLTVSNNTASHTHANKAVLDTLTSDTKAGYDSIASIFSNIVSLDTETLVPSQTAVPSSYAVDNYIQAFDIAQKLLVQIYPVGSLHIGSTSPALFLGGTWTEVSDTGISSEYTVWKRTA